MSNYTGGRISEQRGGFLVDAEGVCIAATASPDADVARRLAACWNACLGIDTERLESGACNLVDLIGAAKTAHDLAIEEAVAIIESEDNFENSLTVNNCADAIRALRSDSAATGKPDGSA